MKFRTLNSTYEVEFYDDPTPDTPATGRVRRLGGEADPTPRQGEDGVWKDFLGITAIVPGDSVIILWHFEGVVGKTTITSEVLTVEGNVNESRTRIVDGP